MNREQRRRQARTPPPPRPRATRPRALSVPFYDGDELVGRQQFEHGEQPYDQLRILVQGAGEPRFHSVTAADEAGRSDLVHCFLLDRSGPTLCYRRQPEGEDVFPESEVAAEPAFDFRGWADCLPAQREIHEAFKPGEIWPLESWLLAVIVTRLDGRDLNDPVIRHEMFETCNRFLEESRYRANLAPERIERAILSLPKLLAQLAAHGSK